MYCKAVLWGWRPAWYRIRWKVNGLLIKRHTFDVFKITFSVFLTVCYLPKLSWAGWNWWIYNLMVFLNGGVWFNYRVVAGGHDQIDKHVQLNNLQIVLFSPTQGGLGISNPGMKEKTKSLLILYSESAEKQSDLCSKEWQQTWGDRLISVIFSKSVVLHILLYYPFQRVAPSKELFSVLFCKLTLQISELHTKGEHQPLTRCRLILCNVVIFTHVWLGWHNTANVKATTHMTHCFHPHLIFKLMVEILHSPPQQRGRTGWYIQICFHIDTFSFGLYSKKEWHHCMNKLISSHDVW